MDIEAANRIAAVKISLAGIFARLARSGLVAVFAVSDGIIGCSNFKVVVDISGDNQDLRIWLHKGPHMPAR